VLLLCVFLWYVLLYVLLLFLVMRLCGTQIMGCSVSISISISSLHA
jgi:hypothetical protein